MDAFLGSTIAALCYTLETEIDFQQLATEMSTAVWGTQGGARLDMPTTDLALCDTPGMRIGLARVALNHTFPGSLAGKHYPSCMVLSVGPGETIPEDPKEARYARVRADLISQVQDIVAADRVLMFERAGAYDTELHDAVVDDIRGHLDMVLCQRREPVSDVVATAQVVPLAEDRQLDEATPVAAFPAGTAAERLDAPRRALEQAEAVPDRRPFEPQPMRLVVPRLFPNLPPSTLGLIRVPKKATAKGEAYPDDEHMPANVDERPLPHRAAENALRVTVMTIALPVGAALLTMSVLGREDMLFSSRVTAVAGVGVGLHNTGMAERLFALFS